MVRRVARSRGCRCGLPPMWALALLLIVLGRSGALWALVSADACSNGCVCLYWTVGDTSWLELRCPSGLPDGWTLDPVTGLPIPPPSSPNSGTFRDPPGSLGPILNPAPGGDLSELQAIRLGQARPGATNKVRREKGLDGRTYETTCSALFNNNPTGLTGLSTAVSTVFRNGEGYLAYINGSWVQPCSIGAFLFVDRGLDVGTTYTRYVFVCNGFNQFAGSTAEAMLIHEWLHIATQTEDFTPTVGPGDPPTSDIIQQMVEDACDDPQRIY